LTCPPPARRSPPPRSGRPASPTPTTPAGCRTNWSSSAGFAAGHREAGYIPFEAEAANQFFQLVPSARNATNTNFRFTAHLVTERIDTSVGTVGDALDNALMESTIGSTRPS
jgi:hypothetical protein